jgi:hypothetical protein
MGIMRAEVGMEVHIPKSTPGFLTIQRRNILILLAEDPARGLATCLVVLSRGSKDKKIFLK